MLDLSRPLELDDGTPVILRNSGPGYVSVTLPKGPYREAAMNITAHKGLSWSYDDVTGIFGGGDAKRFFTLRNVGPAEPEEYEGWFV